ncbi:hypothetical protein BDV28DRAFT_130790 [Aspergillus coremiiformis]|uniref:Aminoglycoside phosphotransferase domain-containing protein n=1 Tax=Aspergillus coremiiformis TaxID=138285 RepID=A0A5N6ZCL4_9EURO|nr:hypothetical protein BDV28DRAFT_130790 [Aspergillus coremiiformis]
MRFISQHTSIPVPRVISAFIHCGQTYILMERIKGDMIGVGWVQRNEESKAKLLSKLKSIIQEMREIPAPEGTAIASMVSIILGIHYCLPSQSTKFFLDQ